MQIERAINICLETEEVETLNEAMGIIDNLWNILEETGNTHLVEFYGLSDIYNKIADVISDFEEKYPIDIKTI